MCRVIMPQEEERIIEISTLLKTKAPIGRPREQVENHRRAYTQKRRKKKRKYKRIWFGAVVHCLNHYYVFRKKGKKLPPSLRIPPPSTGPPLPTWLQPNRRNSLHLGSFDIQSSKASHVAKD
jgi:hypothetical protein